MSISFHFSKNHKKIITSPNCKVKDVELGGISKLLSGGGFCSCKLQHTHTPTHFCAQLISSLKTPTLARIHTHNTFSNWRHQQIFNWRWLSLLRISHHQSHQQICSLETTHVVANHNTQTHQTKYLTWWWWLKLL